MKTWARARWRAFWSWWSDWWWAVVAVGAVAALLFGYFGYDEYYRKAFAEQKQLEQSLLDPPAEGEDSGNTLAEQNQRDRPHSFWSLLYLSIQLFALEMSADAVARPLALDIARFLAPIVAATTAIQALWPFLHQRFQTFWVRTRLRDHVVICGLGRKALLLTMGFRQRGQSVVVIERHADNELLGSCRELGAITLIGNATDRGVLARAGVQRARQLFAVSGNDGVNVETVLQARALAHGREGEPLSVQAHIFDPHFCALLDPAGTHGAWGEPNAVDFFSIVKDGARALLSQYPIFGSPRAFETLRPRLLVVGLGHLGESLIVQAATYWQGRFEMTGQQLGILAVDVDSGRKVESLRTRYPVVAQHCAIEARDLDVNQPEFQGGAYLPRPPAQDPITSAYVSLGDDSLTLSAGLALRHRLPDPEVPIVVSMTRLVGLSRLLGEHAGGVGDAPLTAVASLPTGPMQQVGPSGLSAFGLLDRTCVPELLLEATNELLAMAIHGAYLAALPNEAPRRPSTEPWERLDEKFKDSNRRQADHIHVKLAMINCRLAPLPAGQSPSFEFGPGEVPRLARLEHERWMDERLLDGWSYGVPRDDARKLHPDLVPWKDLPPDRQQKDYDSIYNLPAILAKVGLQIERCG